jgi:hypothetical protein
VVIPAWFAVLGLIQLTVGLGLVALAFTVGRRRGGRWRHGWLLPALGLVIGALGAVVSVGYLAWGIGQGPDELVVLTILGAIATGLGAALIGAVGLVVSVLLFGTSFALSVVGLALERRTA